MPYRRMNYRIDANGRGPYQSAFRKLGADEQLVYRMNAVADADSSRRPSALTLEACVAFYRPDLISRSDYQRKATGRYTYALEHVNEEVMREMRDERLRSKTPLSELIVTAVRYWLDQNVVGILDLGEQGTLCVFAWSDEPLIRAAREAAARFPI